MQRPLGPMCVLQGIFHLHGWNNKVAHSDLMRANRGVREPEVVVWFSAKGVRHASAEV